MTSSDGEDANSEGDEGGAGTEDCAWADEFALFTDSQNVQGGTESKPTDEDPPEPRQAISPWGVTRSRVPSPRTTSSMPAALTSLAQPSQGGRWFPPASAR